MSNDPNNAAGSVVIEPPAGPSTQYPVEFRGKGGEYFKIWIVNVLLIIVTLTIYTSWAKVRTKRYFFGNTFIDNTSFEYHAKPLQLFYGRLIAVAALISVTVASRFFPAFAPAIYIVIALLLPWVIWRSYIFNARVTSFRNIRFGFFGTCKRSYFILVLTPIIIIAVAGALIWLAHTFGSESLRNGLIVLIAVSVYGMYPLFHKLLASYSQNFHRYGTANFSANLKTKSFYWIYIKSFFVTIVTYALIAAALGVAGYVLFESGLITKQMTEFGQLVDKFQDPELAQDVFKNPMAILGIILLYALLLSVFFIVAAYFRSRIRNYRYNLTIVGNRVQLVSTVKARSLTWLSFSNLLLMIITIGFAYPWIKIRNARYFARKTKLVANGSLDDFIAGEKDKIGTLGDELGDAFDLDLDIGI